MKQAFSPDVADRERAAMDGVATTKHQTLTLIGILTLLLLSAVWGSVYLQLAHIRSQQQTETERTLANLTRVNEEHALLTFRAADQALKFMVVRYLAEGDKLDLKGMVDQGIIDGSLFAQLGIIDAQGIFKLSNVTVPPHLDLSDREHFKVHTTADSNSLFISKPVLGRASGKWSIQLTRRINRIDGTFLGVAVASISLDYFTDFYIDLDLPGRSLATMVGLDGVSRVQVVDDRAIYGLVNDTTPVLKLIHEGKLSGSFTNRSASDDIDRLYSYAKITGYPVFVSTGVSTASILQLSNTSRDALVLQAGVLSLLLVILGGAIFYHTKLLQSEILRRQKIEDALRSSEDLWRVAIDGSNDGIWNWRHETGLVQACPRMSDMLGYETGVATITPREWTSMVHPADLGDALAQLRDHLEKKTEFYKAELRFLCEDGAYKWLLIRGRARHDSSGVAIRMAGSATDISEQRFLQAQMQDRTFQLDTIFSLSPDAFVSFDRTMRVKYINPAFQHLTGLSAADVKGLQEETFIAKMNALCAPSTQLRGMQVLRETSMTESETNPVLIDLTSGVRRVLQVNLKTSDSTSVSQILYLRDVTHAFIVEEMKSEFLATAAHELRTPMASILGFSELLVHNKFTDEQRQEILGIIHAQSTLMAKILNELLDLARIEARGAKDFALESVNLRTLVEEIVSGFSLPTGRSSPIAMVPDTFVHADRAKAAQAILNVLANAYKYAPSGGETLISLAPNSDASTGALAGIVIRDHGIGMEPDHLTRVFERFYRADQSGRFSGTGLGMSIVKEIMDLHQGAVLIDSTAGVGTAVTLLFPID